MFSKIYAIQQGFLPVSSNLNSITKFINLEVGLILGFIILSIGIGLSFYTLNIWNKQHFGSLDNKLILKEVIVASGALVLGFQIILYSFFYSILGLKK
jgi:hypothetical protein